MDVVFKKLLFAMEKTTVEMEVTSLKILKIVQHVESIRLDVGTADVSPIM